MHPHLFGFDAISIGDNKGQAFIVPLDESDRETAELIIKSIKGFSKLEEENWRLKGVLHKIRRRSSCLP